MAKNPLEDRDDIVAAMFAAQIGGELNYVDKQTTNRPNNQPQALRLDPKKFLGSKHTGAIPSIQQHKPTNLNVGQTIQPAAINDLMIPLPEPAEGHQIKNKVQIAKGLLNDQATYQEPAKINDTPLDQEQLELPMPVYRNEKPKNVGEWFSYIDKRLNDIELHIDNRLNIIQNKIDKMLIKKSRIKPSQSKDLQ